MVIKYGCVTLRAIEERDADLLFYLINDPVIENCTVGWNFPISYIEHKRWMEQFKNSTKSIKFMIELENSHTIGMIMLENLDWKNRTAEIGYKISAPSENRIKGDMTDAVSGMLKYAFNELGFNCISTVILENNMRSRNLCKRTGFTEEGVLRKRVYKDGTSKNLIVVSILKEEFVEKEILKTRKD